MRQYVREVKAKGAIPIICSLVLRNQWDKNNKIKLSDDSYALWAEQIATEEGALFIDLNKKVAIEYEKMSAAELPQKFFSKDHTHTNLAGVELNARVATDAIKQLDKCGLKGYLK